MRDLEETIEIQISIEQETERVRINYDVLPMEARKRGSRYEMRSNKVSLQKRCITALCGTTKECSYSWSTYLRCLGVIIDDGSSPFVSKSCPTGLNNKPPKGRNHQIQRSFDEFSILERVFDALHHIPSRTHALVVILFHINFHSTASVCTIMIRL